MTPDKPSKSLLHRSLISSIFIGLLAALFIAQYAGLAIAGKYLIFLGWMFVNLFLWSYSIAEYFGRKRPLLLALLVILKLTWLLLLFVLVYFVGIRGAASFFAFLAGFNTLFLIMSLKVLGSVIIRRQGQGA